MRANAVTKTCADCRWWGKNATNDTKFRRAGATYYLCEHPDHDSKSGATTTGPLFNKITGPHHSCPNLEYEDDRGVVCRVRVFHETQV